MSSAGLPAKSGGVNLNEYRTNGMILDFAPIASKLQSEFDKNGSNPVLQKQNIALLVAHIINFQERHCGAHATSPRPFTRFPFEIFRDYKVHGRLYQLLRYMIGYCVSQQWYVTRYQLNQDNTVQTLIDLNDQSLLQEYFRMFQHIEHQLKDRNIIKPKVIHFSPSIPAATQQQLAAIATSHGASISQQHTEAVTHIILPNNADMEDSGDENVRTVEKQEDMAYIHYWFYPSSYDQWIPSNLIDGEAEHIDPPSGAWRVGERFLTDLDKFNEWMVEFDYEILDDADNTPEAQPTMIAQQPIASTNGFNNNNNSDNAHSHQNQNNNNNNNHNDTNYAANSINHSKITQQPILSQNEIQSLPNDPNSHQAAKQSTQTNTQRSRKRKRNDPIVIDDDGDIDDPEAEWMPPGPPSKKQKYSENNDSDAAQTELNHLNNQHNKNKTIRDLTASHKDNKKIKLSLKRRQHPAAHKANKEAIEQEMAAKKKNTTASLHGGDMFPYSGPSLTRIRPMIASYPIVIPSYARWFRLDRIHPIEYQTLSSLFKHKAMQYHERYMQARNFMVNSYRINPRIYLTVTACRRIVSADAGAVLQLHKFLEEWGLINYQVDDGSIPEFELPILDYTHVDTPFGVKIALKPEMEQSNNIHAQQMYAENEQKAKKLQQETFRLRENIFSLAEQQNNEQQTQQQKQTKYGCSFCGIDCTQTRYRCNIQEDMILCSKCFNAKTYSMIYDENDFEMELQPMPRHAAQIKLTDQEQEEEQKAFNIAAWSEGELKKLKEALSRHHDDWTKVSQHVGRDEQECIAQFLQMPFPDTFLDTVEEKRDPDPRKIYHPQISEYLASSMSSSNPIEHMLSFLNPNPKDIPSPFADAGHPVLGQVASLSAVVNSKIVGVASNAALQFITNQKIITADQLRVNQCVETKMGRGKIEQIVNSQHPNNRRHAGQVAARYQVKFEWGSSVLRFEDILDIVDNSSNDSEAQSANNNGSWQKYPQNVSESKAKAAGVLATSAVIAKALKNHKDVHMEQLLQHLVLLQSQKVKAKLAHLEELWFVLQREREEVEEMKQELFRERIELAKQRLHLNQENDDENDVEDEDRKDIKVLSNA